MTQQALDFFEEGKKLQQKGDLQAAKEMYTQAVAIKPDYGQAYNNLGNLLMDEGDLIKAEQAFARALELIPDHPVVLNNLGNCLHKLDQNETAKEYLSKAIKFAPEDPFAHSNIGNVLLALGDAESAVRAFKTSVNLNPRIDQVYVNLGNGLIALNDIDGAVSSYQTAIQINPKLAEAYGNLCALYERHNKLDELQQIFVQAQAELNENNEIRLYIKALVSFRNNNYIETIESLEAIQPNRFPLNFQKDYSSLLAKAYDKAGEYQKAFKQFESTNEIIKKTSQAKRLSGNTYLAEVKALSYRWSRAEQVNWNVSQGDSHSEYQLAFLVGFPRSGTTLLDTILRSHKEVAVVEEKPMVRKMFLSINRQVDYESLTNLNHSDIELLRKIYFDELSLHLDENDRSRIIIDKLPLNILHVGLIKRVFPDSKFILALRHPYDSVLSCFMQNFHLNDSMSNFLSLDSSGELYNHAMALWESYATTLALDYAQIKYEELVNDLRAATEPVLRYLGLDWDDNLLNYQQTALNRGKIDTPSYNQVTQGLYKSSTNRWVNYREYMKDIDPYLVPWVRKFDYPLDPDE